MAADMSGEQMQAKITAARREAEGLKDKIKRRKDELADTSRTTTYISHWEHPSQFPSPSGHFHSNFRLKVAEALDLNNSC